MQSREQALRALIVDDHDIVRLGVRQLLARLGRPCDAAEARSAREALEALQREPVELLLLDLGLGDEFGLSMLPRLRSAAPKCKILVLTSMAEDLYAERCLRAGADGYVMKSALSETLVEAVQTVLAGQIYVSPERRNALLMRAAGRGANDDRPDFSPRELDVLRLVAAGKSTREIADALNRSVKTVETHKQALKAKLGADTPAMLVRKAVAWLGEGP